MYFFSSDKNLIYLLKETGDISFLDLSTHEEKLIYLNNSMISSRNFKKPFYYFLVNDQNIFLFQKNFGTEIGRFIKVIDLKGKIQFFINLDLWRFNIPTYEFLDFKINKICILVICGTAIFRFDIKNGKYIGQIPIFNNSEIRGNHFDHVKLYNTILDEDQIINIHANVHEYPAIIDIYRFY